MAWLVESFPADARLTSVAIGYNVAQCIMGGLTPSIATIMANAWYISPGLLLTGIAFCSLVGLHFVAPTTISQERVVQCETTPVCAVVKHLSEGHAVV